jgi:hypothetical protein
MNTIAVSRLRDGALVLALGSTVILGLAGCAPTPSPSHTPGSSAIASPTATPTPSVTSSPTPTPSAGALGTPTKIGCSTLVSAQAVYDFNPNFGLDGGFSPQAGSAAATAVADGGTACNWLNQTSGDTFSFSVARPAAGQLGTIRATAASGTPASGLGDAAYFSTSGGVGRVDVFRGAYWLTATSVYFGSAADASDLVKSALGTLS